MAQKTSKHIIQLFEALDFYFCQVYYDALTAVTLSPDRLHPVVCQQKSMDKRTLQNYYICVFG